MNKKLFALCGLLFALSSTAAFAAKNIEIYYSPSCPHCHHAMDFIDKTLVPEYKTLEVKKVNVIEKENRDAFVAVLKKCQFQSGGVPVLVVNEKCFQGYAEFMNTDIMAALGPADEAATAPATDEISTSEKLPEEPIVKTNKGNTTTLYILLGLFIAALGLVFFSKRKK